MSGFEASGVVLAILPLLVNQLDKYAQGAETLKTFRTRIYRIEFKGYVSRIRSQRVILVNTLEKCLEDIVDYHDIANLFRNPTGPLWQDVVFQNKLRKRLGRDYQVVVDNMENISRLLKDLQTKLNLEPGTLADSWKNASVLEREIRKFKDIFSKSIYLDLITRLENANTTFRTIIDQVHYRESIRTKRVPLNQTLDQYQAVRQSAKSLYNSLVMGSCWICPCRDKHCVYLHLEPESPSENNGGSVTRPLKLRIMIEDDFSRANPRTSTYWSELEAEYWDPRPNSVVSSPTSVLNQTPMEGISAVRRAIITSGVGAIVLPKDDIKPDGQGTISDMCSELVKAKSSSRQPCPVGFIVDENDSTRRHLLHFTKQWPQDKELHTLKELLSPAHRHSNIPSRLDRLRLAVNIASSVLKFCGTWLKINWGIGDILFCDRNGDMLDRQKNTNKPQDPYLALPLSEVSRTTEALSSCQSSQEHALLHLGLALIELSLGEVVGDANVGDLGNAISSTSNYIHRVYSQSGHKYSEVVKTCLFWTNPTTVDLDDVEFQKVMFSSVIQPLQEDLIVFTGGALVR